MCFDCKKYLPICKACCCGCFPMSTQIIERNRDKIVRNVEEELQFRDNYGKRIKDRSILLTKDLLCAFLKEDYTRNIYNDRDEICKIFGDGEHPFLNCPCQHADGTPKLRSKK